MVTSPIFFMGSKRRLIKRGLIDLFPKDMKRFIDVFGGTGTVSLNVECENILLNDKDKHLYDLYSMFKDYTAEKIIQMVEDNINEYGLAKESTNRNIYYDNEKLEEYKHAYISLRKEFNEHGSIFDLYTLMFYAFSQQCRFNKKDEFNMPVGNSYFSEEKKQNVLKTAHMFQSIKISNKDFKELDYKQGDFVYLDPPYLGTCATYNESRETWWNKEQNNKLWCLCEDLDSAGIKFAMSNVFENKGKVNYELIGWCMDNGWRIHYFDNFSYTACGKGNAKTQEVLIMNY